MDSYKCSCVILDSRSLAQAMGGGGVGGGAGRSVGLLRLGGHHFGPRNLAVIRSREVAAK